MDLEGECSVLESVEDNEVITPERLASVDGNKVENNGSWGGEYGDDDKLLAKMKAKDVGVTELVSSPPLTSKSPVGSVGSPSPATRKGYGLKKWRRIKRELNTDGSSNGDTSKILKRGLSTSAVNSSKPQGSSVETRQKSNGSLSSTNARMKSLGVATDGFASHGPNLDSRLAVGLDFSAGTDSENSEDRSSKSSTAASVPKSRHDVPAVVGYARDKAKMKTLGVKNLVNSAQKGQQGKSRIETSKKARGERVKIEKENSHSSMESDSRSSNFVFMQGSNTVTSNGRQSGRSMNYDDEAQGGEQGEELQTGYSKENEGESEALYQEDLAADLSWEVKEEKVEHHRSSTDQDPLVECIYTLQSAQEELEKEVQKLREIGTEHIALFNGSTQERSFSPEFASFDSKIIEASDLLDSGEITRNCSHLLETQAVNLKQSINLLESKLEEAKTMLKAKEAKVTELEYAIKSNESPKEEMEAELEGLFAQKIEAEVEYLAISRTIQNLRVAAVEEQKTLVLEQAQVLNKLEDAESKAAMLKRRAETLETCCEDIVGTDQVLTLQKGVCKVTSCFFAQLILLFVVFVFFFLQLSPRYAGVVPT